MEHCSECRFWLNWDSEMTNLGECHRYPPRMATVRRVDGNESAAVTVRPEGGGWPLTAPDDWCGEFQRPRTPGAAPPEGEPPAGADAGPVGL